MLLMLLASTLIYGSETWPMLEGHKSHVRALEISCFRDACIMMYGGIGGRMQEFKARPKVR